MSELRECKGPSEEELISETLALVAWNRRAAGWIPCGERLPEERRPVIVTDGRNVGYAYMIANAWHISRERDNVSGVTHWHPLPLPPEG
jgi:hypothetical protein